MGQGFTRLGEHGPRCLAESPPPLVGVLFPPIAVDQQIQQNAGTRHDPSVIGHQSALHRRSARIKSRHITHTAIVARKPSRSPQPATQPPISSLAQHQPHRMGHARPCDNVRMIRPREATPIIELQTCQARNAMPIMCRKWKIRPLPVRTSKTCKSQSMRSVRILGDGRIPFDRRYSSSTAPV